MKRLGLEPNHFVYTSIGSAMLHCNDYYRADAFIQGFWPRNQTVDSALLEVAFHAKMRTRQYQQGVELLRKHTHIAWDRQLRKTITKTILAQAKRPQGQKVADELKALLGKAARCPETSSPNLSACAEALAEALRNVLQRSLGRVT